MSTRTDAKRLPVRSLYYWSRTTNFGDVVSKDIVAWALGADLPLPQRGDDGVLLATGSIAHHAGNYASPVVWGTGVEPAYGEPSLENAHVLALRGPKSAERAGLTGIPFGDPAILLPRMYQPNTDASGGVGLVAHHRSMSSRNGRVLLASLGRGASVIDPRRPWRDVVDDVVSCRFVFCESLHGAIVAQVYGVPWAWWKGLHGARARFKWHDWFASLGATPRSFLTTRRAPAEEWAASTKLRTPDGDDLLAALVDHVEVAS